MAQGERAWAGENGETLILFGDLFDAYAHISDKVVGMLLRARKHSLLYFEGETLFQVTSRKCPENPIKMEAGSGSFEGWWVAVGLRGNVR